MKKEKIQALEQALCMLLRERELKKITVKEVCMNAGVSRSAFYTYFDDIYSLAREIEDRILDDVMQIMEKREGFDFQAVKNGKSDFIFSEICKYCYKNRDIYRAMFGFYGNAEFVYRYERIIFEDFMRRIDKESNIRFPEMVASACSGAAIWLCRTWFSDIDLARPEEVAMLHTDIVYKGILLPNLCAASKENSPDRVFQRDKLWPVSENWGTTKREEGFWKR